MIITLQQIIPWFLKYKYFIIFPLAGIEGPIITIVVGWLASTGHINLWGAYFVLICGDLTSDCFYYMLGRFGSKETVRKYSKYIGLNPQSIQALENHFHKRPHRTFILGKIAHGAGTMVLFTAGFIKLPFRKFLMANILPTVIKSFILILVGYYFGRAYKVFDSYLSYLAIVVLIIFITAYIIFIKKYQENKLV